jgi:hypothetical protein
MIRTEAASIRGQAASPTSRIDYASVQNESSSHNITWVRIEREIFRKRKAVDMVLHETYDYAAVTRSHGAKCAPKVVWRRDTIYNPCLSAVGLSSDCSADCSMLSLTLLG